LLDDAAPVANSLKGLVANTGSNTLRWVELGVLFGAMMGMISLLLVFQLGQARVWFSMSRDGLLPKLFGRVHPKFRTPATATWIAGFVVGIPAGILDIGTLSDLSNIGTLFAFVLVSVGVIILRYRQEVGHADLPAPALGPAVRRRRRRGIRKSLPQAPYPPLGDHGQRTRIPADSRKRLISN